MPEPRKPANGRRDLDGDGDIDLADDPSRDLDHNGRIEGEDREEQEIDSDNDSMPQTGRWRQSKVSVQCWEWPRSDKTFRRRRASPRSNPALAPKFADCRFAQHSFQEQLCSKPAQPGSTGARSACISLHHHTCTRHSNDIGHWRNRLRPPQTVRPCRLPFGFGGLHHLRAGASWRIHTS